ncbi:MAG: hypothetical protein ABI887_10300 [Burkholderiales bacterium]
MKISAGTGERWINAVMNNRRLLMLAASVFVVLLSFYVRLLHHSIAQGESLRQAQRSGVSAHKAGVVGRAGLARERSAQALVVEATP